MKPLYVSFAPVYCFHTVHVVLVYITICFSCGDIMLVIIISIAKSKVVNMKSSLSSQL